MNDVSFHWLYMWPPSYDLAIELIIQFLKVKEAMKLRLLNHHLNFLVQKKCHLLKLTAPTVTIGQNRQHAPSDDFSTCPSLPYILLFLSHHDILRLKLVNRRICDLIRRNFHRLPKPKGILELRTESCWDGSNVDGSPSYVDITFSLIDSGSFINVFMTNGRIRVRECCSWKIAEYLQTHGQTIRCDDCIFKGTGASEYKETVQVENRDYKIDGMAAGLQMILTIICKFSDITSLVIKDNRLPLPEDCLRAMLDVFRAARSQVRCLEQFRMYDGFRAFSEELDCRMVTVYTDLELPEAFRLFHNFDLPLRMFIEQEQIQSMLSIVDLVREWERGETRIRYLQLTFQEVSHDRLPCSNTEVAAAFSSFDCFPVTRKRNAVELLIRRPLDQSKLCLQYSNVSPFMRYVILFEVPDISKSAEVIDSYELSIEFLCDSFPKKWY